jgi:hypothetical protein
MTKDCHVVTFIHSRYNIVYINKDYLLPENGKAMISGIVSLVKLRGFGRETAAQIYIYLIVSSKKM